MTTRGLTRAGSTALLALTLVFSCTKDGEKSSDRGSGGKEGGAAGEGANDGGAAGEGADDGGAAAQGGGLGTSAGQDAAGGTSGGRNDPVGGAEAGLGGGLGAAGLSGSGGGSPGAGGTEPLAGAAGEAGGGSISLPPDPCRGAELAGTFYVPDGFCARVVATGVTNVRQITFSSDGSLWAVSADGPIYRLTDANEDGAFAASEIAVWGDTGGNGQNAHIDEAGGFLYAGTPAGVKRWPWSAAAQSGGAGEDVVTGQPSGGSHKKHTVHAWDGWLYIQSGSASNVVNPASPAYDSTRSLIKRFRLADFAQGSSFAWSTDGEVFADGLRNTLGFNRDALGRIYGVQNGQDNVTYEGTDVNQDNPGEVIVRLESGTSHGYPFCFVAQAIDGIEPGTQVASSTFAGNPHDDAWCQDPANALPPVTFVQAHTAPMDIVFYTGPFGSLPQRWRNGAFVSLHGSHNRDVATGYKVIWLPFNADGTAPLPTTSGGATRFTFEVVFGKTAEQVANSSEKWLDGTQQVRPVGVAISPTDGSLYVSSDQNGSIYRVGLKQ